MTPTPYSIGLRDGYDYRTPHPVLFLCAEYWRGYGAGLAIAMGRV